MKASCGRMQPVVVCFGVACLALLVSPLSAQEPKLRGTINVRPEMPRSVVFSPDGKTLASDFGNAIMIWDAATGDEIATFRGHTNLVTRVAYSPDGKTLASGSWDKTIKLWDAATGEEKATLRGHEDYVVCVAFSPDGKTLASGGRDRSNGRTIRIWEVATGTVRFILEGNGEYVNSVCFSSNGKQLASSGRDTTVKVWDVATGKEAFSLKGHLWNVQSVAFSPDGKTLASAIDLTIKLWDAATGKERGTLDIHNDAALTVAFSPDGKILASGTADYGTVILWDVSSGHEIAKLYHPFAISSVAFSPDGKTLVSACKDKTINFWDVSGVASPAVKREDRPTVKPLSYRVDRDAELKALKKEGKPFGVKGKRPRWEDQKFVVTSPLTKDLVVTQRYVGNIFAQRQIDLRALVTGVLTEVLVKDGQAVKKGDVLFKISPDVYQAKLDAELANVRLAEQELNAAQKVPNGKKASQQQLALLAARLAEARARVKAAEMDLDWATFRAPFGRVVDRLRKQAGDQVKEGDILATLTDADPALVIFDVPEANYLEYMHNTQRKLDHLKIELVPADGNKFDQVGKIVGIEANFNNESGKIPFRAEFPNPQGKLQPGKTVTVLVHLPLKDAVVIPQRATLDSVGSRYAYVVGEDGVVHPRKLDIRFETDKLFVTKGVDDGEKIVLDGVRWVRDGDKIDYEFRKPEEVMGDSRSRPEK